MKQVFELNSFNLGALKDENSGRVALYHYLKNLISPQEPVTPGLINRFYGDCLQLPHWQDRRAELSNDIVDLLKRFFGNHRFDFNQLWDLNRFQFLLVCQSENFFSIVKNYEQATLKEGENLRVILDGESRAVALKKQANGEVIVRTYNNLVRIASHCLVPLGYEQELHYDEHMELKSECSQQLRIGPHSQARFIIRDEAIEAQFLSGFAFRQSQALNLTTISQDPRIFYPLKRLEKFYIYRPTDPYYMELIATLDKSIVLLKSKAENSFSFASQAFEGGQIAFDQIFPDDKALYVRLRELAKHLSVQGKEVRI